MRRLLLVLPLVCSVASQATAQELSVRAEAGLGGVARAGRWMPVAIVVENGGGAREASLTATVGDDRMTRQIGLAAGAAQRYELFLRAPDADAAVVRVDLSTGASAQARVEIRPFDEPFTLCVSVEGREPQGACTARADARRLSSSWRGFDAADEIAWPAGGPPASLLEVQRQALTRADAVRDWNRSTGMAPQWRAMAAPKEQGSASRLLVAYSIAFVAIVTGASRLGRRPALVYAAAALAATGASAVVLADGRIGRTAALHVFETSVIRAGTGLGGAQVYARGIAVVPAAGPVSLGVTLEDAELALRTDAAGLGAGLDDRGEPAITGRAAKAQAVSYEARGFLSGAPVEVRRDGTTLEVTNRLSSALIDCTVPSRSGTARMARLSAGSTVRVEAAADAPDVPLVCGIEDAAAHLTWNRGRITHQATAVLMFDLRMAGHLP